MAKIRIGNDIQVSWEVTTSGEALSLEGRSLRLYVLNAYRKQEITEFSVSGDVITFYYRAAEQKTLGAYCVELEDTYGGTTRKVCADLAFTLVAHTSEEADNEAAYDGFDSYLVSLRSNILVGRPGMSAYEIWQSHGHTGTEDDFLQWLRQSAVDAAAEVKKMMPEVQEATEAANKAKETANEAAEKANEAVQSVDTAMSEVDVLKEKAQQALSDAEASEAKSDAATARANAAAENAENASTSFFNATTEVPLEAGKYYVLINTTDTTLSAVHVAKAQGKLSGGLFLTFKANATEWKHYQYVGATTDDENWLNAENWVDLADIAPGAETLVVVDRVCGAAEPGYTLATAIAALVNLQTTSGTTYIRKGTAITYTQSDGTMDVYQYIGVDDGDKSDIAKWKHFGGPKTVTLTQDDYDKLSSAGMLDDETIYNVLEDE